VVSHGHRPWKKIIVIDSLLRVSSMEGEQCKLPEIIAVCKKIQGLEIVLVIFIRNSAQIIFFCLSIY
jgi:7-keto-8-aminopelargonate synthetase-like enzyme